MSVGAVVGEQPREEDTNVAPAGQLAHAPEPPYEYVLPEQVCATAARASSAAASSAAKNDGARPRILRSTGSTSESEKRRTLQQLGQKVGLPRDTAQRDCFSKKIELGLLVMSARYFR